MVEQSDDQLAQRREMIDLIAETRSRSIRVALFATQLHRPDPDSAETSHQRENALRVLLDTVRWIERVSQLLSTHSDPWEQIPPDLCRWLSRFSTTHPDVVQSVKDMCAISIKVAEAAQNDVAALGAALREHYEARCSGFFDHVTRFCDAIWREMDTEREFAQDGAHAASDAILKTVDRLAKIGRHVKLVSLNASVESARIGDAGRGLSVIATEFKTLAEEIQCLAQGAHADIAKLTTDYNTSPPNMQ